MGILTHISSEYDDSKEVQRIFAVTRFAPSNRSSLNRVASRAAVMTGVGQRTLVAAAYDELDIDMVWRDGPFSTKTPEEKWPDAQVITFHKKDIEVSSSIGDILNIAEEYLPRGKLSDSMYDDIDAFRRDEKILMVWEIPYDVGGMGY